MHFRMHRRGGTAILARSQQPSVVRAFLAHPFPPYWPAGATPPKHLDATMLGDYGFDPLRLGSKDKVRWVGWVWWVVWCGGHITSHHTLWGLPAAALCAGVLKHCR